MMHYKIGGEAKVNIDKIGLQLIYFQSVMAWQNFQSEEKDPEKTSKNEAKVNLGNLPEGNNPHRATATAGIEQ